MSIKKNKRSKAFNQRKKELRQRQPDSPTMRMYRQLTEEFRVRYESSIQKMVNKLLSNKEHDQPTVAPNSTSDTMVKTSAHLNFNSNKYFETDSPKNVLDITRPSRDSSASDDD
ncbi:unnamed protein product [Macrosiphum euphorbiae]|uniref:Uncharacterized protein n=1 Tax=Macrosiphum euphorbiae TaxID=13131 RepID=A0AAV0Y0R0_9HEMI|nr:unnamed protein product [Macrosiphum euphorbiae]